MISRMKKSVALLSAAALLLLGAVGLVAYGTAQIPPPTFHGRLHDFLPPPPPGWTMKEKPIADTPEMKQAVGELLNFSDGVFVDYLGPAGERLSVYMAYWVPGKMSHRLVATHTPDVCWVGGGWKKTEEGRTPSLLGDMPSGESRTFTANGTPEYVWYWHLVGTESKSYATGQEPPWYASLTDLFQKGLKQREEQFFIRLSSDRPLDAPFLQPILTATLRHIPWPPVAS